MVVPLAQGRLERAGHADVVRAAEEGGPDNRDLFTQAGLDPDDPPTTWQEVREDAKAIADATGQAGYATMTQSNTGGWILTTLVNAMGGSVEEFDGETATATIDTPEMRQALDYLRTLRWTDGSMGSNFLYDWGGINQAFASGQIGMYVSGGGNYGNLFTQNALDPSVYGLTVIPLEGGSPMDYCAWSTRMTVSSRTGPRRWRCTVGCRYPSSTSSTARTGSRSSPDACIWCTTASRSVPADCRWRSGER